jgi:hypothetical protein
VNRLSRIRRLEKVAALARTADDTRPRRDEGDRAAFEEAWAIMSETMSEEHARMVVDAYAAGMQDVRHPEWGSPAGTLLRRCLDALHRRPFGPDTQIKPEVALAMPPDVADVYLSDPDALPLHSCEDCGYRVPHQYFQECPLCGGRVGWNAYWHKQMENPRTAS